MDNEQYIDGLGIADGVVETIVELAVSEVEGVAGIGSPALAPLSVRNRRGGKQAIRTGVEVTSADEGLYVKLRIQVFYGFRLTEVAANVRAAVADAISGQVGGKVCSVDVFIDGIVFAQ